MDKYAGIFLLNANNSKIVLLQRSPTKEFAPNRWTGIGGHVEKKESFTRAVIRELVEETNITQNELKDLRLVADFTYKDGPYWPGGYQIVWFAAEYDQEKLPECTEGKLEWVSLAKLSDYDIIDDTKAVLKLLMEKKFGGQRVFKGKFMVGEKGVTDKAVLD